MVIDENEVELSDDVENLIYMTVKEYHDKRYEEIENVYRQIRDSNQKIHERLNAMEELVHAHAVGVQNVYKELLEIKNLYNVVELDSGLMDKIAKTKELWE